MSDRQVHTGLCKIFQIQPDGLNEELWTESHSGLRLFSLDRSQKALTHYSLVHTFYYRSADKKLSGRDSEQDWT